MMLLPSLLALNVNAPHARRQHPIWTPYLLFAIAWLGWKAPIDITATSSRLRRHRPRPSHCLGTPRGPSVHGAAHETQRGAHMKGLDRARTISALVRTSRPRARHWGAPATECGEEESQFAISHSLPTVARAYARALRFPTPSPKLRTSSLPAFSSSPAITPACPHAPCRAIGASEPSNPAPHPNAQRFPWNGRRRSTTRGAPDNASRDGNATC
ncbi:hypothetical protein OH77DRAFT_500162 [Trametes cingulata]|nr:hypothetical protein OH77DRAFT_500162 [Trametes cingulata]